MDALSWINFLLGLWLVTASLVLSRAAPVMAADSIGGIAIAVLAFASAVGLRWAGISWGVAAAGLWTLIVNFGGDTPSQLNAVVIGLIVTILGTANAIYRHRPRQTRA